MRTGAGKEVMRVAARTGRERNKSSMANRINLVKVFSVTRARERDELGERVTAWIKANPDVEIVRTVVAQTSDDKFHCLSMVLICATS